MRLRWFDGNNSVGRLVVLVIIFVVMAKMAIARGEGKHSRQRHINIKFHVARKYYGKLYELIDTRGDANVADLMTKPLLSEAAFTVYRDRYYV